MRVLALGRSLLLTIMLWEFLLRALPGLWLTKSGRLLSPL